MNTSTRFKRKGTLLRSCFSPPSIDFADGGRSYLSKWPKGFQPGDRVVVTTVTDLSDGEITFFDLQHEEDISVTDCVEEYSEKIQLEHNLKLQERKLHETQERISAIKAQLATYV